METKVMFCGRNGDKRKATRYNRAAAGKFWNPIVTINLTDGIGYTYTSNKIQINIL